MEIVPESEFSPDGDDDKIYVFFTETAVEFEFYDKILVSRIARICKVSVWNTKILFTVFQMKFRSWVFNIVLAKQNSVLYVLFLPFLPLLFCARTEPAAQVAFDI